VITCMMSVATAHIATLLQNYVEHSYVGTQNSSGDEQLHLDIDCDNAVFRSIREAGVFAIAASEETPEEVDVSPKTGEEDGPLYSLGFDPLDGSSVIDANFSVGSIFGIWPGKGLLGRTGREQVASVVSVYGPRTTLIIALPSKSRDGDGQSDITFEVTLVKDRCRWEVSRTEVILDPSKKIFAPGNLRATNDNSKYDALVKHWISERYTLRYSGGMVPDVYHMIAKSGGVFRQVWLLRCWRSILYRSKLTYVSIFAAMCPLKRPVLSCVFYTRWPQWDLWSSALVE